MPVAEPPPAGHAAAAAQLLGQRFPRHAGLEDEDDAGQHLAIVQWRSSSTAVPVPSPEQRGRKQRFDEFPKTVRDQWLGHRHLLVTPASDCCRRNRLEGTSVFHYFVRSS